MPRSTESSPEHERRLISRRPEIVDPGLLGDLAEERAEGRSYDEEHDWRKVGVFGAGLAIGLAVGVASTLLLAPRTGEETRELIGHEARRLGGRMADGLDDLRDEMRWIARRGRRRVRRGFTRGKWTMQDAVDRGRRYM